MDESLPLYFSVQLLCTISVQILIALTWEHLQFSAIWSLFIAIWGHINPCPHSEVSTYLWGMHTKWWKSCHIIKLPAYVSICSAFYKLVCVKLHYIHDIGEIHAFASNLTFLQIFKLKFISCWKQQRQNVVIFSFHVHWI